MDLFIEHIANYGSLHDHYEAKSIYWLEDLDLAATLVKRALEQMSENGERDSFLADLTRDPKEEQEFVTTLLRRCIEFSDEHEKAIAEKASNWEADRIAYSDMILMKMALTEVRVFDQIPVKVTMNEYIEIAKAYSTPKSKGFINGVLDKLFIEMKADGRIRKVGRGLLES
jgi:N utilization substance protein B